MQWNAHVIRILELIGFIWARENSPCWITMCNQKVPNKMAEQHWREDYSMEEFFYQKNKKEMAEILLPKWGKTNW